MPAVKKGGVTTVPANPYNRCHATAGEAVDRAKLPEAFALPLPPARPCAIDTRQSGHPVGLGGDYSQVILRKQTISKRNAESHTSVTGIGPLNLARDK